MEIENREVITIRDEVNDQAIGKRIQRLREKFGYSREELAEKLEITWQHLGNIERGTRGVSHVLLLRLRVIFQVTADYLICGEETENDYSDLAAMLAGVDKAIYPFIEQAVVANIKSYHQGRDREEE